VDPGHYGVGGEQQPAARPVDYRRVVAGPQLAGRRFAEYRLQRRADTLDDGILVRGWTDR
jgi:hypothetical protein